MRFEEAHTFTAEEARERINLLIGTWQRKITVDVQWEGLKAKIRGAALGVNFWADIEVLPNRVVAEGMDPGILFRSRAVSYLKRKLGEYFDPTVTVAELGRTRP